MPSPVGLALTIRLPGSGFFFFFSERAWGHPVLSRPIFSQVVLGRGTLLPLLRKSIVRMVQMEASRYGAFNLQCAKVSAGRPGR